MKVPEPDSVDSIRIANFLETTHDGDCITVDDVNGLDTASQSELSFSTYEDTVPIEKSNARVVVCPPQISGVDGTTLLRTENPKLSFLRVVDEFFSPTPDNPIIHSAAIVEDGADIGDGTIVGPFSYIASNVSIGENCRVYPGTIIGTKGKGYVRDEGRLLSHRYRGSVTLEDNIVVGCNCVIDKAIFGETRIETGTKLDNLIHVAHDATIGSHVWINQLTSLAGNCTIGDSVRLHPCVSIGHDVTIGEHAVIGMNSTVLSDVEFGTTVVGIHSV